MKNVKKLPPIGARIVKSSVSVALCMVVYFTRSLLPIENGIPFYSALAALWCLQPYANSTKNNAWQRTAGTFTGAAFGLVFILFMKAAGLTQPTPVYLLASAVIIPVIYMTVIMDKRNASFFSCVVFLSIALTHSFDDDPYLFVFNRVLDTFIGIGISLAVNGFHLPIKHDSNTLYVSGIDSVLIPDDHSSQYSKVELNRLIEHGVSFTVSTVRTPAEVLSLMKGVDLRLPIIAMDGAALYDIKEKVYLEAEYLDPAVCEKAEKLIQDNDTHYFANALYDSTLLIFFGRFRNNAEKELYDSHKQSPYRNYIRNSLRHYDDSEKVLYLTVLETADKVQYLEKKLLAALNDNIRVTVSESEYEGYLYLKVFSPNASKSEMMNKLKEYTGMEKVLTFGSIKGEYDVYIGDGGGNATVKRIKKLYRHSVFHG